MDTLCKIYKHNLIVISGVKFLCRKRPVKLVKQVVNSCGCMYSCVHRHMLV
jgi:hypothetical protein